MQNLRGKVLMIANPAAQRGNGASAAQTALELLRPAVEAAGGQMTCMFTEHPGHAVELAQASAGLVDAVIALGGDGIVHEVVNGLMRIAPGMRPAFGLVPVGSGNDFARTLGMSEKVNRAVEQLLGAHMRTFDVGVCNGEYFAETLSFGLDAAIALDTVERRKSTGLQGTPLYALSGFDQLFHHLDTYRMRVQLAGGEVLEDDVHLLAVQNGQTYGGGFRICPEADPCDGLLDLCWATAPMRVPEATVKFLSAKNAHHLRWKNIHFARAASLELSFDRRPPCQIDGEAHVAEAYSISVEPAALRVLASSED